MLNIPKLTPKDLIKEENFKEIFKMAIACFDNRTASNALALLLEDKVKEIDAGQFPKQAKAYQDLILLLKFEALPLLNDREVILLLENHVLEALEYSPNFLERLRDKLFLLPIIFRDEYLAELKEALRRNKQKLGKKDLAIIQTQEPQPPLVSVWLLDYDNILGTRWHTDFQRELYFRSSPNPKKLNQKERELLDKLLRFYDLLSLTIRDPGGLASYSLANILDLSKIDISQIEKILL